MHTSFALAANESQPAWLTYIRRDTGLCRFVFVLRHAGRPSPPALNARAIAAAIGQVMLSLFILVLDVVNDGRIAGCGKYRCP